MATPTFDEFYPLAELQERQPPPGISSITISPGLPSVASPRHTTFGVAVPFHQPTELGQRTAPQSPIPMPESLVSRGVRQIRRLGSKPTGSCTGGVSKSRRVTSGYVSSCLEQWPLLRWANIASSTKYSGSVCSTCGKKFSRGDALKRHEAEQKHGQGLNNLGEGTTKEYLCPTLGCERSIKEQGFKRQTHLRDHLKTLCRADLSLVSGTAVATPGMSHTTSPKTAAFQGNSAGYSLDDHPGGGEYPEEASRSTVVEEGTGLGNRDKISYLEQCYRADEKELRDREQECQRLRERLALQRGLIEMYAQGEQ